MLIQCSHFALLRLAGVSCCTTGAFRKAEPSYLQLQQVHRSAWGSWQHVCCTVGGCSQCRGTALWRNAGENALAEGVAAYGTARLSTLMSGDDLVMSAFAKPVECVRGSLQRAWQTRRKWRGCAQRARRLQTSCARTWCRRASTSAAITVRRPARLGCTRILRMLLMELPVSEGLGTSWQSK